MKGKHEQKPSLNFLSFQGKMYFYTYSCFFPPNVAHIAIFFFILFFDLISMRHKYLINYIGKLLCASHAEVSNISDDVYCIGMLADCRCSFLIQIVHIHCILTGREIIKSLVSGVWKCSGSIVRTL